MVPIPAKYKIILGTIIIGLVASGQYLLKLGIAWVWLPPVLAGAIYIEGFLTVPAGATKTINELTAVTQRLSAKIEDKVVGLLLVLATCGGLVGIAATQTGCPAAVPAVGPAASCVSAVVADALAGLSIDEILAKEKGACVADLEEVIAILLGSTKPQVVATKAYGEAKARRASAP